MAARFLRVTHPSLPKNTQSICPLVFLLWTIRRRKVVCRVSDTAPKVAYQPDV